jgi:hypothetical protein
MTMTVRPVPASKAMGGARMRLRIDPRIAHVRGRGDATKPDR